MLQADAVLARTIAQEAAALLRDLHQGCDGGHDGKALGRRADAEANALILARLHAARPGDFILSEESTDDPARCGAERVWIVDPLDGTSGFCRASADYAVHIGLAVAGVPRAGAVALPATGQVFSSDAPPALPPPHGGRPRIVVSDSRPPRVAELVAAALDAELLPMGSAGVKAMAVLLGKADIYLHAGGQYEWDNCAPAAVALSAGLHASRIDGRALVYNCADPLLPDLLICRAEWAAAVLRAVAVAG
ncbi:3'(2'),5'-bisphosphate nucleotidase CysQ [Sphingomonas sp.]|uniref:3'(2'),5'-bisphosphate nucleotidase CysQ n=1 Tax=Sphingomonas sp. TaxID=28214 RepID=UPI001D487F21|nr:3'(2'),5'-bisphosphate nucleotidase CysQ [Sphingomonas sp.]MBX9795609.1 3'(2'),5'-bisphosphate nucleotidase CysQ [Sphingomonas sp.]